MTIKQIPIIFCFILTSCLGIGMCDTGEETMLTNKSDTSLIVRVHYDSTKLHKWWPHTDYKVTLLYSHNFASLYPVTATKLISVDTINFTQTYVIQKAGQIRFHGALEDGPENILFDKISIYKGADSIILTDMTKIKSTFINTGGKQWEFNVQ